jgi:hypothetical protein
MKKLNYTRPDEDYEDKPEDWLFCALTYATTLSFLIPPQEGIIVDLKGDAINLHPGTKRVIVHNDGIKIGIIKADERGDLKAGDRVKMIIRNNIIN